MDTMQLDRPGSVRPRGATPTPTERADLTAVVAARSPARQSARLAYLDNLRAVLTAAVVVFHLAIAYGAAGAWYYTEHRGGEITESVLTLVVATLQFFFMGLFFAIAGYFVPPAYERKGLRRFLTDRLRRLGIPLVLFAVVVSPVLEGVKAATSNDATASFWSAWRWHLVHLAPGPLWFVEALLVFSIVYALWRGVAPQPARSRGASASKLDHRRLFAFLIGLAAASFVVRLRFPIGDEVEHLQLAFFPQYVALFVVGILAHGRGWLDHLDDALARTWLRLAGAAVLALPVVMVLGGATDGNDHAFEGGVHWQAAAIAILEALVCVGVGLGLIALFRQRFGRQGKRWRLLTANAYTVYIIHAPIVVGLTYALKDVAAPPLLKFALLSPVALVACLAASHLLVRKLPGASRVL